MAKEHPCNIVNAMTSVGYTLSDMLPAFPGKDEAYLDAVLIDNAKAFSRPVRKYGILGIHPCTTRYFNVSEHGFRKSNRAQAWPPERTKKNIFFFGGSTAVGFGLEDSHTIPSYLQHSLDKIAPGCEVYNFGSGSYTSRQEALLFLDLLDSGLTPDHAIFLDGVNDSFYAYGNHSLTNALDSLYQTEKKRRRMSYLQGLYEYALSSYRQRRTPLPTSQTYDPGRDDPELKELVSQQNIKRALEQSSDSLRENELTEFQKKIGHIVWEYYRDSVEIIRAVGKRMGVKPLFVWQPTTFYGTRAEHRVMDKLQFVFPYHALCSTVYHWLHAVEFPEMHNDNSFIDLSKLSESLEGKLYIDIGHYNARFSEAIAESIAGEIAEKM